MVLVFVVDVPSVEFRLTKDDDPIILERIDIASSLILYMHKAVLAVDLEAYLAARLVSIAREVPTREHEL